MLARFVFILLLLANGLFWAWSQGWLRDWGFAPLQQTEPQRLAQQVRPDNLRLLSPQEARRIEVAATPKPTPPECLEAGLLDAKQSAALRPLLTDKLPNGAWAIQPTVLPARWILYMGKFANAEAVGKKKQELKALGVSFEALRNASLEPGLALGGFDTQAKANAALKDLARNGVRTARVVQERPETHGDMLRLPAVDDKLRPQLDALKPVLGDKGLQTCR